MHPLFELSIFMLAGCPVPEKTQDTGEEPGDTCTWYADLDGDAHGDPAAPLVGPCEPPPTGHVADSADCDDTRADVGPGAPEVCDGRDNDCDGGVDEDLLSTFYADGDGDGFGDGSVVKDDCGPSEGWVQDGTDCDDTRSTVFPGAQETCDGLDEDCDGETDEDLRVPWYEDLDGDGFGNPWVSVPGCEAPCGFVADDTDCDDAHDATYPGAEEVCDTLDNDCDGETDEGVLTRFYQDGDGDGYGADPVEACTLPDGASTREGDCDDTQAAMNPGADETCDGLDNDCDGDLDEGVVPTWYADTDGDGWGDAASTREACAAGAGWTLDAADCDDTDPAFHPGAPETDCTDPNDYNCDGSVAWADGDADGWAACTDCDDTSAMIHPGADETCDDTDDDCDGEVDEGVLPTWYADRDGDGHGDAGTLVLACAPGSGWVLDATDCDDTSAVIHPGTGETCNDTDDDCDGEVDEGVLPTWYADRDGDGHGDAGSTVVGCTPGSGWVLDATDCDDTSALNHPDAAEEADGLDNDCDGEVDEGLDTGAPLSCPADMALVDDTFCMDRWEASRPDATSTSMGSDTSRAVSAEGVQPWFTVTNATAEAACAASGKRLCTPEEWYLACAGPEGLTYAYGDTYEADTCNGLDAHCLCAPRYEGCYYDCGGAFTVEPTGRFGACVNAWGVYDLNGNVWEHVAGGDDTTIRGGAYNCGDSPTFHRCDYVPTTWSPSARGFRCCGG